VAWKAAGLGLWLHGGGSWFTGDPVFAALGLVLGLLSFGAWVATGNAVAPPVVWVGLSGLAAWRADGTDTWDATGAERLRVDLLDRELAVLLLPGWRAGAVRADVTDADHPALGGLLQHLVRAVDVPGQPLWYQVANMHSGK
jgi:hypothetical protein